VVTERVRLTHTSFISVRKDRLLLLQNQGREQVPGHLEPRTSIHAEQIQLQRSQVSFPVW
jgi:hypothetical protein